MKIDHDSQRPSILLISAWNLYNIGDVAHTPGFLRLVERHFPEAHVTVLAMTYPDEIQRYVTERFPDCTVMPMEFEAGESLSAETEDAFSRADILLLNSGMTLSFGYHSLDWNKYMRRIAAFFKARNAGIPYGVWAHSIDRIDPPADIVYKDVLSAANVLYTRDTESLTLLQRHGITSAHMGFCPDSAFAFDLRGERQSEEFMREHRLRTGRFIVFVPRLDVNRFRDDGREWWHAAQTRELITRWVRLTGEPVVIMHEVKKLIEPARQMVYDLLPEDVRQAVAFQPQFWMPDECVNIFTNARLVVSAEMHSVILALAAGTPSLHPYFTEAGLKQWMMRDLGLEKWMFDQDSGTTDAIFGAMQTIHTDPQSAAAEAVGVAIRAADLQRSRMQTVQNLAIAHRRGRISQDPRPAS